jgi:hypothetical protein
MPSGKRYDVFAGKCSKAAKSDRPARPPKLPKTKGGEDDTLVQSKLRTAWTTHENEAARAMREAGICLVSVFRMQHPDLRRHSIHPGKSADSRSLKDGRMAFWTHAWSKRCSLAASSRA